MYVSHAIYMETTQTVKLYNFAKLIVFKGWTCKKHFSNIGIKRLDMLHPNCIQNCNGIQ
jgi:hypothetical protein